MSFKKMSASLVALTAVMATSAVARDQVQVAGSSTVLPYSAIVAEAFGENFDFPTPVIESGGSSAGLKRFCEGVGETTIDIANSSRAIRETELKACAEAGVTDIIEVRVGYDGIVFASDINGNSFEFTPLDWYRALAAEIVIDGQVVANPYTMWNEVNPALPAQEIQAYVPGTKHGTREVFEDKVIEVGWLQPKLTWQARRVSRCGPMAVRWISTVITPRPCRASRATRTGSAFSVCRFTKTTPTSCRSQRWVVSCPPPKRSRRVFIRCRGLCSFTSSRRISA